MAFIVLLTLYCSYYLASQTLERESVLHQVETTGLNKMGKKSKGGAGAGQKGKGKGKGSVTDQASLLGVSAPSRQKKPTSKGGRREPTPPRGATVDVTTIVGGGGGDLGGLVRQKGGVRANSVEIPRPTKLDLSLRKIKRCSRALLTTAYSMMLMNYRVLKNVQNTNLC